MSDVNNLNLPDMTPLERYLWDGTGTPDAVTARIETALRPLRFSGKPLVSGRVHARRSPLIAPLLVAAVIALVGVTVYLAVFRGGSGPGPGPGPRPTPPIPAVRATWTVASIGKVPPTVSAPATLKTNVTERTITTDGGALAQLSCGSGTTVDMRENSSVRVLDSDDVSPWATLEYGSVLVQVAANDPPVHVGVLGEKVTVKPGTTASIDLNQKAGGADIGCKSGEVAIDWAQTLTRMAAPASCSVQADKGPSVPLSPASSSEFCGSLTKFEEVLAMGPKFEPKEQSEHLAMLLSQTTRKDAPALWNLLSRVEGDQRIQVRNRLLKLTDFREKIDPDAILKLDRAAMDALWKACVEAAK